MKNAGKQKAAKYYAINLKLLREDARNKYKNLSEKEKNKKRKYQRKKYHINTDLNERLKQYQRNYYASKKKKKHNNNNNNLLVKKKFGDIAVNKREFHASKQAIALNLVNTKKSSCF